MSTTSEVTYGDPDDDIVDELCHRGFGIVCLLRFIRGRI